MQRLTSPWDLMMSNPPTSAVPDVGDSSVVSIGYVSQLLSADGALICRLSAKLYGLPKLEREARIANALEFMGLAGSACTSYVPIPVA